VLHSLQHHIPHHAKKNNFYTQKIHYLRKDDIRQWWHTINTMSGRGKSQPQITIERDGQLLSEGELLESLYDYSVRPV
jgi:hypothetical protein